MTGLFKSWRERPVSRREGIKKAMIMIPMASTLRRNAEIFGAAAPALLCHGESISWGELEARANRRARQFAVAGVRAGDFVTVMLPNGPLFYECTFAIWKLGATPNPLSVKLPAAELGPILDLVKPALIFADDHAALDGWRRLTPVDPVEGYSSDPVQEEISRHWKAITSGGSTGRPKVIVDNAEAMCDPSFSGFDHRPGEVVLNPGPLYHSAPFMSSHFGLFVGDKVIEMGRFDASDALRLIDEHRVNWVNFVPTMMHRIWMLPQPERAARDVSSLRMVWHMGAPMPRWLKEAWIDWIGAEKIFELYSGTERQGATIISGEEWLRKKGSVGRMVGGAQVKVVGEDGAECAPGEVGEIYMRPAAGAGTTYHYRGAEPKSHDGGWETIGDMGWVDEDGYVFIADRRTDMILRGGANVYPAEVEALLNAHPAVISSVVIGLPDRDLGQTIHALVEHHDPLDLQDLHQFLRERIAAYKLPLSYELLSEPLWTETGKVRRAALRDQRLAWLEEGRAFRSYPDAGSRT